VIRHNIKNGKVIVKLSENQFIISNSGNDKELNSKTIFNRFSKSSTSEKGNGLGLSIVKKIVDINKWSISYSYKNNLHSFIITF
jgi:signal transduction histidine kinase